MLKNIQRGQVNILAVFVCILLGGCFKSAPMPNPQIEDTVIQVSNHEEIASQKQQDTFVSDDDDSFFDGDYAENEIAAKIFFAFDSDRLSERDRALLDPVAEQLKKDANKSVYVFGYADWRGTDEYNDRLSKRRNQAIMDYLGSLGVKAERLHGIALGNRYATPNLSKPDGLRDRRCDVVIH